MAIDSVCDESVWWSDGQRVWRAVCAIIQSGVWSMMKAPKKWCMRERGLGEVSKDQGGSGMESAEGMDSTEIDSRVRDSQE